MRCQDFDGYISSEPGVARAVHLTHAACPEWRLNLVRPEFRTSSERHRCALLYSNDAMPMALSALTTF